MNSRKMQKNGPAIVLFKMKIPVFTKELLEENGY